MAVKAFKTRNFSDVTFQYPHVNECRAFDHTENRSIVVAPNYPAAKWEISFLLSKEQAKEFEAECVEHFNQVKAVDPKISTEFGAVHGLKENDGVYTVTAHRKGAKKNGELNEPPTIVDAWKMPLEDREFWSGSKGNISLAIYPASNPSSKKWGVSILINKIQIIEAVKGGEEDDFTTAATPRPSPSPQPASTAPASPDQGLTNFVDDLLKNDLEDSIPF